MMTLKEMQQCKKENGLSYKEISERSGIPFATVQKVLSGTTKTPRHQTLSALEKVFQEYRVTTHAPFSGTYGQYAEKSGPLLVSEPQSAYGRNEEQDNTQSNSSEQSNSAYPRQGTYTLEDYLTLTGDQRAELIDGVIYDMSSPNTIHQVICGQLHLIFANAIEEHNGSCEVFISPMDVQLDQDNRTIVEPDLFIICHPERIQKTRIFGAPDLVIEILSPSTRKKDMTLKMWKYSNAGVCEYWIVDPDNLSVAVYDFANELKLSTYTFHDKVPVGICDGKLLVDFETVWKKIERFY